MFEIILHSSEHALIDTLKLIPILFLAYLLMEYLEHHTGNRINKMLEKSKKTGPLIGSALGIIPQCGFSGAAANLYSAGQVTAGTMLAVFIATSDEMLPILLSARTPIAIILLILAAKLIGGVTVGVVIDFLLRKRRKQTHDDIHSFCEHEHCSCDDGIFVSALKHTVKIVIFIFIVTLLINIAFEYLPEDKISAVWNIPIIGEIVAAVIGLIPNCSSSVLLTNLYVKGVMGLSPMLAGLMVNAGVGLLVLFRVNKNHKDSIFMTALLFISGIVAGGLLGTMLEFII